MKTFNEKLICKDDYNNICDLLEMLRTRPPSIIFCPREKGMLILRTPYH